MEELFKWQQARELKNKLFIPSKIPPIGSKFVVIQYLNSGIERIGDVVTLSKSDGTHLSFFDGNTYSCVPIYWCQLRPYHE